MAKLSTRVDKTETGTSNPSFVGGENLDELARFYGIFRKNYESDIDLRKRLWVCKSTLTPYKENSIKQENTMNTNTLKEVTLTLIDNNIHLEDDQRIVFQKKGVRTSFTLEETKMNIIASGEVMEKLEAHNKNVRAEVVNEDILERTGRSVFLKPIKLLSDSQLQWRVVETA